MKQFETASRRGQAAVTNAIDLTFEVDGVELTAHPPTSGQMAMFVMKQQEGGLSIVYAMFDFLSAILDDEGVELLREKLADGVEISLITDIIQWMIGEWSGRPTKPSSASPKSRKSTGRTSTAKQRSKA